MTLTLTDIPRVRPGTLSEGEVSLSALGTERAKLAARAKELLGYNRLKAEVTGQSLVGVTTGKLTECLLRLDLQVLDTASVIQYQLEEMTRRNREFISNNLDSWAGTGWRSALATWQKTDLASYDQPIPEFVLDKAVRIKEALPEVHFNVQHLDDPKADPFLVAVVGKEVYYVDAWDEPRFEGGL
jgi:hypothetical protein